MLRSDLCHYSDTYNMAINLGTGANNNLPRKNVVLKDNALFRQCTTKK